MPNNSDFDGLLPDLKGLVDPKVETKIYVGFRRIYDYFTAKLNVQKEEFDIKLAAATVETSNNLNSLIGIFSQPLAGSSTVDPLLESLIQNFGPQAANTVFAGPNGSIGSALFRALVAADIPTISAAKITSGVLLLARLDPKILKTDNNLSKVVGAFTSDGYIEIKDNNGNSVKVLSTLG